MRLDAAICALPLMEQYIEMAPNAKLPGKFHNQNLLNEHRDEQVLFTSKLMSAAEASRVWGGHIRTHLTKLRELVKYEHKREALKSIVHGIFRFTNTASFAVVIRLLLLHFYLIVQDSVSRSQH